MFPIIGFYLISDRCVFALYKWLTIKKISIDDEVVNNKGAIKYIILYFYLEALLFLKVVNWNIMLLSLQLQRADGTDGSWHPVLLIISNISIERSSFLQHFQIPYIESRERGRFEVIWVHGHLFTNTVTRFDMQPLRKGRGRDRGRDFKMSSLGAAVRRYVFVRIHQF